MRNIATFTDCVSLVASLQEQSCDMSAGFKILVLSEEISPVKSVPLAVGPAAQNEQAIDEAPSPITICPLSQYTALLGQEFDIVIYDLSAGFRASAFLVLSGLVRGDGWLFLTNIDEAFSGLTFSYSDISTRPNPNNEHIKKPSYLLQHLLAQIPMNIDNLPDNFISRMGKARFIEAWEEQKRSAATVQQRIRGEIVESILKNRCKTVNHKNPASDNKASCEDIVCGEIVCEEIVCEDEVSHHVVAAPRGRGKSYLLGQIIGDLTTRLSDDMQIGILTHNRKQISSLLEQTNHINTLPPDVNFNQYAHFDILVIDEAASFPVELLLYYRNHAKYLIYGTTTHGYEGTGMGFTHKYLPKVLSTDRVHQYTLAQPFRFISPCPIEQVCDDAISQLSTNTQHQDNLLNYTDGLHWLATQALRENTEHAKTTLAALMRLLSLAHYQTTPDDLQRIIDSDDMRCLIFVGNKRLIGCVWLIEEGLANCDHSLKQAILSGQRRVPGHLTVQQLSHGYHIPEILEWNVWRINRIAVHPSEQNKGIGSSLMQTVIQCAQSLSVNALTSSFGADQGLVSFWQKQGFTIWKEGQKANKVTGYHHCIVGLTLNTGNNKSVVQRATISLGDDASEVHEKQSTNVLIEKHYILAKQWQGVQKTHITEIGDKTQLDGSDKVNKSGTVNKSENVNKSDKKPKLPIAFTSKHGNESPFIQAHIDILQQYIAGSRSLDNAEASIFWFMSVLINEEHLSVVEEDANATIWLDQGTVEKSPDYFNISALLLARYQHGHSIKVCCKKFQIQGKKLFSELVAEQLKVLLLKTQENKKPA